MPIDVQNGFEGLSRKNRKEIDSGAIIPGRDPFDIVLEGEKFPQSGILVFASVSSGYNGVAGVVQFDSISKVEVDDRRSQGGIVEMTVSVENPGVRGKVELSYENPSDPEKNVQPYNRESITSYLGYGFNELDIYPLLGGGRLLIQTEPSRGINFRSSFYRDESELDPGSSKREVLRLFEPGDFDGARSAIEAVMLKLVGTSQSDASLISLHLAAKLQGST